MMTRAVPPLNNDLLNMRDIHISIERQANLHQGSIEIIQQQAFGDQDSAEDVTVIFKEQDGADAFVSWIESESVYSIKAICNVMGADRLDFVKRAAKLPSTSMVTLQKARVVPVERL